MARSARDPRHLLLLAGTVAAVFGINHSADWSVAVRIGLVLLALSGLFVLAGATPAALGMLAEAALSADLDRGSAGDRYQVVVHVDSASDVAAGDTSGVPVGEGLSGTLEVDHGAVDASAETWRRIFLRRVAGGDHGPGARRARRDQ